MILYNTNECRQSFKRSITIGLHLGIFFLDTIACRLVELNLNFRASIKQYLLWLISIKRMEGVYGMYSLQIICIDLYVIWLLAAHSISLIGFRISVSFINFRILSIICEFHFIKRIFWHLTPFNGKFRKIFFTEQQNKSIWRRLQ